jgi:hypothetical protein
MLMMTKEILDRIPALYSQEETPLGDQIVHVKFFTPWAGWTWYGLEYDPAEKMFFGYVDGLDGEYGYFSLTELESIEGPVGLKIERDRHFGPTPMSEIPGLVAA